MGVRKGAARRLGLEIILWERNERRLSDGGGILRGVGAVAIVKTQADRCPYETLDEVYGPMTCRL